MWREVDPTPSPLCCVLQIVYSVLCNRPYLRSVSHGKERRISPATIVCSGHLAFACWVGWVGAHRPWPPSSSNKLSCGS